MLNQVFSVQWNHPAKNDWAYLAKQDLVDFEMDTNLSSMKIMSEWAFKNQIRKKAHKYEFDQLMQIKLKHTKLDDLSYDKLEMQNYLKLENINTTGAQTLFRYRSRMANYGENFRGQNDPVPCPLCKTHLDNQKMCFENCPVIKDNLHISGKYSQIFSVSVPSALANTLLEMDKSPEDTKV